jgi:2-oxoglutarate ferredoxin oxidoreductase subunit delta
MNMSEPRQVVQPDAGHGASRTRRSKDRRPPQVRVDPALCKSCGICVKLCPRSVFDADPVGRPLVARPQDCNGCRFCEMHCPDLAIEVLKDEAPSAPDKSAPGAATTAPVRAAPDDEGDA